MLNFDDSLLEELYDEYGDFIVDISIEKVEEIYDDDMLNDIEKHDDIFNLFLSEIVKMNDNIYCNHMFIDDLLESILKMVNILQAEMGLKLDDEESFDMEYKKLEGLLKSYINQKRV